MSASPRLYALDNLRTLSILLVLARHSIFAYQDFYAFYERAVFGNIHPILDTVWTPFSWLVGFSDRFHITTLFFVSGIFLYRSFRKYGPVDFLVKRWRRLGRPMLLGIVCLVWLFYLPAFWRLGLKTTSLRGLFGSWALTATNGFGNLGPFWFLYVLFGFNLATAFSFKVTSRLGRNFKLNLSLYGYWKLIGGIILLTLFAEVFPFVVPLGLLSLSGRNFVQYLGYFLLGGVVGYAQQRENDTSFLNLLKRVWLPLSLTTLGFFWLEFPRPFLSAGLILSGIGTSLRFLNRPIPWLTFLNRRSFGIYYLHYLFVVYLHFWLLQVGWHPGVKALLVFSGSLGGSLGLVYLWEKLTAFGFLRAKTGRN